MTSISMHLKRICKSIMKWIYENIIKFILNTFINLQKLRYCYKHFESNLKRQERKHYRTHFHIHYKINLNFKINLVLHYYEISNALEKVLPILIVFPPG